MGWLEYNATHFYKDGSVNRKAECDAYFNDGLNKGFYEIVKSTLKGSTYYAAVRQLKRCSIDENGNDIVLNIPKDEQKIHGYVFRTGVRNRYLFSYKLMSEDMGPFYYDCPSSIIHALSPIDNDQANYWRKKCLENAAKNKLSKLSIGTKIKCTINGSDYVLVKHKPAYQFKTSFWMIDGASQYIPKKLIPSDFSIV